jgi:N-acetylneuraminic acid mutarotase
VIAGELYVTGGDSFLVGGDLGSVEKYTPSTDTWSDVAPMPVACTGNSAVAVSSDLYVLGSPGGGQESTMLKFDVMEGTWSEGAPLPEPKFALGICAVGSAIYVFGGLTLQGSISVSAFKFDIWTNAWSSLAPMPHPCLGNATYINGLVYLAGAGINHLFAVGGQGCESSVDLYDVNNDTWTPMADLPLGRLGLCAISIGSGGPADEQDLFDSLITQTSARRS